MADKLLVLSFVLGGCNNLYVIGYIKGAMLVLEEKIFLKN